MFQFFPWGQQRYFQGYLDDRFASLFWLPSPFQQTLSFRVVPHTDLSTHPLASSVLLCSGAVSLLSQAVVSVCKWCLGPGHRPTSLRTSSSVWIGWCRSSRVTEHWGAFRAPSLTAWKVDPQWRLLYFVWASSSFRLCPQVWECWVSSLACSTQALPPTFTLFPQPLSLSPISFWSPNSVTLHNI